MAGVSGRAIALLALVVLTGCGGADPSGADPAGPPLPPAEPLPAVPPPTSLPATGADPGAAPGAPDRPPSEYQIRLTRLDQELGGALDRMRGSREPEALRLTTLQVASVVQAAGQRMRADPRDPAVTKTNIALADGLGQLANELTFLAGQAQEQRVCTGPAAIDTIATAPSMPALRSVAAGLSLSGGAGRSYRWGGSLPPPPTSASVPPPLQNGAILVDRRGPVRGNGVLEVRNESPDEAVLVLARDGTAVATLAVAPGRTAALQGVPDGDYQLAYTSGRDWDARLGAFGRDCLFRRFNQATPFRTRTVGGNVDYTVQTAVVRPGAADATTTDIPATGLPG
jgi:hypothetical protein